MKKEDIILKKGDKVYFFGTEEFIFVDYYNGYTIKKFEREFGRKITKIERPTNYETIYEAPKEILDEKEKEYLEAVLKPFKNKIKYIEKMKHFEKEYLHFCMDDETWSLPDFNAFTMYKRLELYKPYTIEKLGLFTGRIEYESICNKK